MLPFSGCNHSNFAKQIKSFDTLKKRILFAKHRLQAAFREESDLESIKIRIENEFNNKFDKTKWKCVVNKDSNKVVIENRDILNKEEINVVFQKDDIELLIQIFRI